MVNKHSIVDLLLMRTCVTFCLHVSIEYELKISKDKIQTFVYRNNVVGREKTYYPQLEANVILLT